MIGPRDRRPLRAVIFDMDGVLADTEPIHQVALRAFVAPGTLTDAQYHALVGTGIADTMAWIRETYGRTESVSELRQGYHDVVHAHLAQRPPRALPGAAEAVDRARRLGLRIAVASQSAPAWVEATLRGAGLRHRFITVVTADEVPRAKPAPDIYLRAADRLGVEPAACLAIEDSAPGVASALRAGMRVVQSRQTRTAAPPQHGVAQVVRALTEIDFAALARP